MAKSVKNTTVPSTSGVIPKAKELSKKLGVNVIWQNSKGEFFTSENLAQLSEPGKKPVKFDFSTANAEEAASVASAKADADAKADVLSKIAAAASKEDAEAFIAGFENDADVQKAIADKAASL